MCSCHSCQHSELTHGCTYTPEMVESLFSNAVHEECMERLTERENYDLRFQILVIQAPEAVRLSQSQDPWDI